MSLINVINKEISKVQTNCEQMSAHQGMFTLNFNGKKAYASWQLAGTELGRLL